MKNILVVCILVSIGFSMSFEEYNSQFNSEYSNYKKQNFIYSEKESSVKAEVECKISASISKIEEKEIPTGNTQKKGFFTRTADTISSRSAELGFKTEEILVETGLIPTVYVTLKLKNSYPNYHNAVKNSDGLVEKKLLNMLIDSHKKLVKYNQTAKWKVDTVYLNIGVPPSVKWAYRK